MSFEIVTFGDPILRVRAESVARVTVEYKRLVDGMMETMHAAEGVGLAAQQVGRTVSVCVVDIPVELDVEEEGGPRLNPEVEMPLIMFNPKIVTRGRELARRDEGCLSFPGIHTGVQRAAEVDVTFVDWKGAVRTLHCRGLLARAVQHELDHLDGVLLVDRMSPVKKISMAGKLKRLRAETEERMLEKKASAQASERK
ncbi:MAG: peptide deformylase [bacterium]|jgi:peptide deformylase